MVVENKKYYTEKPPIYSLIGSVLSYLIIIGFILYAIISPEKNSKLISDMGFLVLFIEFLSIVFSALIPGVANKLYMVLFTIYSTSFILLLGINYRTIVFAFSILAKIFSVRIGKKKDETASFKSSYAEWSVIGSIIIFMLSYTSIATILDSVFTLPDVFYDYKMNSAGEIFNAGSSHMIFWALSYFSLLIIYQIRLYFKKPKAFIKNNK